MPACLSVYLSVCLSLSVRLFTCLYACMLSLNIYIYISISVSPLVNVILFPSLCRMDPEQIKINTSAPPLIKNIIKTKPEYTARKLDQSDLSSRGHDQ